MPFSAMNFLPMLPLLEITSLRRRNFQPFRDILQPMYAVAPAFSFHSTSSASCSFGTVNADARNFTSKTMTRPALTAMTSGLGRSIRPERGALIVM